MCAASRAGFSTSWPGAVTPSPAPSERPASCASRWLDQLLPPLPTLPCHLRTPPPSTRPPVPTDGHHQPTFPAARPRLLSAATCLRRQLPPCSHLLPTAPSPAPKMARQSQQKSRVRFYQLELAFTETLKKLTFPKKVEGKKTF